MPDTADHRVEMHRLVTQRRAEGKPIWDRKIQLRDVFHNDGMAFDQRRDAIVRRIRSSGWLDGRDDSDNLVLLVEELAEVEDADALDNVWSDIYDEADYDRVWIGTF